MVGIDFLVALRFSINALGSVPLVDCNPVAVNVLHRLLGLSLSEIFNRSQHISRNGLLVLNNFLDNHRFRETLLKSLGH